MNNELEVTYLKHGIYDKRETLLYDTFHEALKIFNLTLKKFKRSEQQALITIRVKRGRSWFLEKVERV